MSCEVEELILEISIVDSVLNIIKSSIFKILYYL